MSVRDKPSFDDLEPPAVATTPIDGLSDEQWAAKRERGERRVRIACGLVFGVVVGCVASWRALLAGSLLATALIVAGCAMLFAALGAGERHDRVADHAAWILFPEYFLVEKLPFWFIAGLWVATIAMIALFAGVLVAGLLWR